MTFGKAIKALDKGKFIQRKGWHGKGMFVFGAEVDISGLKLNQTLVAFFDQQNKVSTHPFLCLSLPDGSVQPGWLASQADILADDWQTVNIMDILKSKNSPLAATI